MGRGVSLEIFFELKELFALTPLLDYSETPQTFHFVEARSEVPLKQDFKPAVTLLSRRPQIATRQSPTIGGVEGTSAGLGQLGLDDEDSEEEWPGSLITPDEVEHFVYVSDLEDAENAHVCTCYKHTTLYKTAEELYW